MAPGCEWFAKKPAWESARYQALKLAELKPAIFAHDEFTAFNEAATAIFAAWSSASTALLKALQKVATPNRSLVVEDKWLVSIASVVQGELDRVSQTLTGQIRQLAERYATPLPQLVDEVASLSERVAGHLKKMGFLA